jgi:hypothetical protein
MPSSLFSGNAGLTKERGDVGEVDQDEGESDTDSEDEGSTAGNDEDPAEEEEEEAERKGIQEEMKEMAESLRELASVVDYNTQFTDPRALAMLTQKTKCSMDLLKKIKKKETLIRSHTSQHLPAFNCAYSDLMFIRTRPQKIATNA